MLVLERQVGTRCLGTTQKEDKTSNTSKPSSNLKPSPCPKSLQATTQLLWKFSENLILRAARTHVCFDVMFTTLCITSSPVARTFCRRRGDFPNQCVQTGHSGSLVYGS
eukprot:s2769_g8.t1